jgi:hypothetical protein
MATAKRKAGSAAMASATNPLPLNRCTRPPERNIAVSEPPSVVSVAQASAWR